ncbi:hypothetical protein HDU79_000457, partial [Rhizoclosmatium sp. JEL0117]
MPNTNSQAAIINQPKPQATLDDIYNLLSQMQSHFDSELTQLKASQSELKSKVENIQTDVAQIQRSLSLTCNQVFKLCNPSV